MNIDSPFEQWRLKNMQGMAASRDIMELLAVAFEGGRVAEREAWSVEKFHLESELDKAQDLLNDCLVKEAFRKRGEK